MSDQPFSGKQLRQLSEYFMMSGNTMTAGKILLDAEGADVAARTVAGLTPHPPYIEPVPNIEYPKVGSRWRHKKRGSTYTPVSVQTRAQCETPIKDDETLFTYLSDDGHYCVRRPGEFMDGRFEPIADAPKPQFDIAKFLAVLNESDPMWRSNSAQKMADGEIRMEGFWSQQEIEKALKAALNLKD